MKTLIGRYAVNHCLFDLSRVKSRGLFGMAKIRLIWTICFLAALSAPAKADDLPDVLAMRFQQGIQACLDYYISGASLSSLQQYGFKIKGKSAELKEQIPGQSNVSRTRVFTEGYKNGECEIHSNYIQRHALKNAFYLTKSTVFANDFQAIKEPRFGSPNKTIFQRGSLSMFMKVRLYDRKLMIKFLRRGL